MRPTNQNNKRIQKDGQHRQPRKIKRCWMQCWIICETKADAFISSARTTQVCVTEPAWDVLCVCLRAEHVSARGQQLNHLSEQSGEWYKTFDKRWTAGFEPAAKTIGHRRGAERGRRSGCKQGEEKGKCWDHRRANTHHESYLKLLFFFFSSILPSSKQKALSIST